MTKWFDTNYHYLVPRLAAEQRFRLDGEPPAGAVPGGAGRWHRGRGPVLLGPVTFLLLSKTDGWLRSARPAGARCCRSMPRCCAELAEAGCRLGAGG